ncbi:MAG: hypothetical protein QOG63_1227 [Thermoleophilaceae bacterium]|jgi:hypothetical protein|nr:hypothetical protein [Thermoleophilaceae bacterium]
MAQLTPEQRRTRDRVERLIGVAAPVLNLVLAAGDRLSRVVEPEDSEYYPVRSGLLETEGGTAREARDGDVD